MGDGGGTLDKNQIRVKATGSAGFDPDTDSLEAISDTLAGVAAASGPGGNLVSKRNGASKAERGARLNFSVSLRNNITGALVPSADIDITGITQTIGKSEGGSFSGGGLTAPVFVKVVGGFEVQYLFVDGEWPDDGSASYKMEISGVTATIGADVIPVETYSWSAAVGEEADHDATLDTLATDAGTGFTTVDGKLDTIDGRVDELADRPTSETLATRAAEDIGAGEIEITNATQHTAARDQLLGIIVRAAALNVGAANMTIRIEVDGVQRSKGLAEKETGSAVFEEQLRFPLLVESGQVVRAFITSSNALDTGATTEAEFFEVG